MTADKIQIGGGAYLGTDRVDQDGTDVHIQRMVLDQPWEMRIARGGVPGQDVLDVVGRNQTIVAVEQDVWEQGGAYNWLTVADALEILSVDANDTAAGTGARTVELVGLDSSYDEITEIVSLNGVTAIDSVKSFIRLLSARVLTAGSGAKNAGAITIRNQAGTVVGKIAAGENFAAMAQTTIPDDRVGYLMALWANAGLADLLRVKLYARRPGEVFVPIRDLQAAQGHLVDVAPGLLALPARTDIVVSAQRVSGASTNIVAAGFQVALIEA